MRVGLALALVLGHLLRHGPANGFLKFLEWLLQTPTLLRARPVMSLVYMSLFRPRTHSKRSRPQRGRAAAGRAAAATAPVMLTFNQFKQNHHGIQDSVFITETVKTV